MRKKEYIMPKVVLDSLEGESLLNSISSATMGDGTTIPYGGNASDAGAGSADSKIGTFKVWTDED